MFGNENIIARSVPENFGPLRDADANARFKGPCDDTMEFWMRIIENQIVFTTFTTDGCYYSMLCGSVAALMLENLTIEEALKITQDDVLKLAGDVPDDHKHCAKLAATTIKMALNDYRKRNGLYEDDRKPAAGNRESDQTNDDDKVIARRLSKIKNKFVVLSGKGGVGKSTIAVNLAVALSLKGYKVGLLDIDLHGPSIPTMLNLKNDIAGVRDNSVIPIVKDNLKVISIGFFVKEKDAPIVWRGPMKANFIRQFIKDVDWGSLDYLIIDSPPGTGDEPLTICQTINDLSGSIIVTTPQDVAVADVSKSINFCKQLSLPIIGVIENMNGFKCPVCGKNSEIFRHGGGKKMCDKYDIPFLGSIPLDINIALSGDEGAPFVNKFESSNAADAFDAILGKIINNKKN